jgi:hypothetical protein
LGGIVCDRHRSGTKSGASRLRRARKLRLRLGGDPTDDEYPDKPLRMRWATYNRLLDKLRAVAMAASRGSRHSRVLASGLRDAREK